MSASMHASCAPTFPGSSFSVSQKLVSLSVVQDWHWPVGVLSLPTVHGT